MSEFQDLLPPQTVWVGEGNPSRNLRPALFSDT
jgi:hypothetical protein